MRRIKAIKLWISITIPSLSIFLSNKFSDELINLENNQWIIHSVLFLLTASTTLSFVDTIFSIQWIRMLFADKYSAEGFWVVKTEKTIDDEKNDAINNPILATGIIYLTYHGKDLKLKAVTSRLNQFHKTDLVISEIAYINDSHDELSYLNYFRYNVNEGVARHGIAYAEFNFYEPNEIKYVGKIKLENEKCLRKQSGEQIEWKKYKLLKKKFGSKQWTIEVLKNDGNIDKLLLL